MAGKRSSVWAKSGSRKVIYRPILINLNLPHKNAVKMFRMILPSIFFLFLSFVQVIQNYGEAFVHTVQILKCLRYLKSKSKGLNSKHFQLSFFALLVRRFNVKLHRKLLFQNRLFGCSLLMDISLYLCMFTRPCKTKCTVIKSYTTQLSSYNECIK